MVHQDAKWDKSGVWEDEEQIHSFLDAVNFRGLNYTMVLLLPLVHSGTIRRPSRYVMCILGIVSTPVNVNQSSMKKSNKDGRGLHSCVYVGHPRCSTQKTRSIQHLQSVTTALPSSLTSKYTPSFRGQDDEPNEDTLVPEDFVLSTRVGSRAGPYKSWMISAR